VGDERPSLRVVGVDIGGTNVRAGFVEGGQIVDALRRTHRDSPYGTPASYSNVVRLIAELVAELQERNGPADGVGLSISGVLSADRRTVVSNNGVGWVDCPVVEDVRESCRLPVVLENDGNCATWGEYVAGVGQRADPFVLLTLGTGVGGGTIIGGQLVRGSRGAAGELGHICVAVGGRACPCGAIGCLEQYASGPALLRAFARLSEDRRSSDATGREGAPAPAMAVAQYERLREEFGRAVLREDPLASVVMAEVAGHIATGISAMVRVCDPAMVAIGGGLSAIGAPLVEAVRKAVREYPSVKERAMTLAIELAEHRESAGVLGAALLCESHLSMSTGAGLGEAASGPWLPAGGMAQG
jgi:glucokinase